MTKINDRCPSCGLTSLFIGEGGWLTCGNLKCVDPALSHSIGTLIEDNPEICQTLMQCALALAFLPDKHLDISRELAPKIKSAIKILGGRHARIKQ